jgi:hypothetical protein
MIKTLRKKVTKEQKRRHDQTYLSKISVFRVSREMADLAMQFITENGLRTKNIVDIVHLMVWHLSDNGKKTISPNVLTLLPTPQEPFKPSEKTLVGTELKRVNVRHHVKDAIDLMCAALCNTIRSLHPNVSLRAYEVPDYILKLAINYYSQLSQKDKDAYSALKAEDRLFSLSVHYFKADKE